MRLKLTLFGIAGIPIAAFVVAAGLATGWYLRGQPHTSPESAVKAALPTPEPAPTPTPIPERCLLGYPNSSQVVTVELTGPGANDVCNNLVNPIRAGTPFLKNAKAMVGDHPWATYRACHFREYGLDWTIWDVDPSRYSTPHTPGGYLCAGHF